MADNFYCSVCDISCSGVEPYVQHMGSNKHKKKQEQKKLIEITDSAEKNFFCSTCAIPCSGIVPYQQHMASEKHLKKLQTKQFTEKYFSTTSNGPCFPECEMMDRSSAVSPSLSKRDEFNVSSSEMVDERVNTALHAQNNFSCEVCDKQFTGLVPYEQHMSGIVHKKKLQKIEFLSAFESGNLDVPKNNVLVEKQACSSTAMSDADNLRENSTPAEMAFKCSLCEKDFPTQKMRDLHLLSSAHKTEQNAFPSEAGHFCAVCDKKFTGSIPYTQHMSSIVHYKNVKKSQLFANMSVEKNSEADSSPGNVKSMVQNISEKSSENSSFNVLALRNLHNIGTTDSSNVLAECYVCGVKFYTNNEIKEHYESESHYDNQNIFEYKKKVSVFAPDEPFNL